MQRTGNPGGLRRGSAARLPIYRLSALGLLILVLPVALLVGLEGPLGLDSLREHQFAVLGFVAGKPMLAALIFMAAYGAAVAVSLPGVALMTMLGGYLFGWLHGAAYVLLASTIAAGAVFMLARGALARPVRLRAGPSVRRFARGFRTNALGYVFALHLLPILPFGMVIALPAAFGVRPWVFVFSTFFGLMPGTVLLAHLGEGLGAALSSGHALDPASFMTPQILGASAGLAVLALLPVAYRALQRQRA